MSRISGKTGEFPEVEETVDQEEYQHASGTFIFRAHIVAESQDTKKSTPEKDWQRKIADEQNQLIQEQDRYNDILFVPVTDVYRNVPRKMLNFFKWYVTV